MKRSVRCLLLCIKNQKEKKKLINVKGTVEIFPWTFLSVLLIFHLLLNIKTQFFASLDWAGLSHIIEQNFCLQNNINRRWYSRLSRNEKVLCAKRKVNASAFPRNDLFFLLIMRFVFINLLPTKRRTNISKNVIAQ